MTASQLPPGPLHPAQRRYLAEDLVRMRRSDELRRYAAPQRAAKIDANPHQIDAVIFALARLREGGCILADEVGLGKTIEAGLVIAQLMAEGARRVLLVAPKPLLGQWRQELFQLFEIDAREGEPRPGGFEGDGVFLIGREAAGSERGRVALLASEPFDLWVIDEAHEVFAGIYKRFDKFGQYREDSQDARTAGRLREVLLVNRSPVLLLTATPIQNNLTELWGLVQYVDPLGTLLGDLATFRDVFCGDDDRRVAPGQEQELRARLKTVLQRTLRRQAQAFLEKPFVNRQARLFEYPMSVAERALYDDVSSYLLEPGIVAFQGNQRQLLLLGFHRRMASSTRALAASLERVGARLRRAITGDRTPRDDEEDAQSIIDDLEADDFDVSDPSAPIGPAEEKRPADDPGAARQELARVEGFIQRAGALGNDDSKFRALLRALEFVTQQALVGRGAGKLVIFTESLVTQEYLHDRLVESRLVSDHEITLFRGTNKSKRVQEALERWRQETPQGEGAIPSVDMAARLALIHEFRTRSRVFISTEAGAKGLNLQFCDTLVNYDLPWNPQRIEQRIGRCHRYGQQHDVTVINFLAKDNEAQRLTFEILSQKLELFGTVLDASDQILHRTDGVDGASLVSALGGDFEAELRRIYDRARSLQEVTAELRALRDKVADERRRYEESHMRTASLIEDQLDEDVRHVFRQHRDRVPRALAELDRDLLAVAVAYLETRAVAYERVTEGEAELLRVAPSSALPAPLQAGITVATGASTEHTSLNLGHPLVVAAVAEARAGGARMSAIASLPVDAPEELRKLAGKRGCLRVVKVSFDGFERIELLLPVAVFDGGEVLEASLGESLLRLKLRDVPMGLATSVDPEALGDAVEETLFGMQSAVDAAEQSRFERAMRQGERYVDDRLLVLKRRRQELARRLELAQTRREGATSSEGRTEAEGAVLSAQVAIDEVDGAIGRLENRDDETYRQFTSHIHERRYCPPRVEHLFDVTLVVQ
jgi:hypothetical protein